MRKMANLSALMLAALGLAYGETLPGYEVRVPSQDLIAANNPMMGYVLFGPQVQVRADAPASAPADQQPFPPPKEGYGLVAILPGNEDSGAARSFAAALCEKALGGGYVAAQLLPAKWTPQQRILWPVLRSRVPEQAFGTEEFVESVVKDVGRVHKLNPARVFVLAWGDAGLAAYAAALQPETSVKGAFVAMSPFSAGSLPPLAFAAGRAFYLYHSPQDTVTPASASNAARLLLTHNGAVVELAAYEGGHGWQGDYLADVRKGIRWLEAHAAAQPAQKAEAPVARPKLSGGFHIALLRDSFETGRGGPDGWEHGPFHPAIEYMWRKGGAYEGDASVCIRKVGAFPTPGEWSRTVDHIGGAPMLRVIVRAKPEGVARAAVQVRFIGAGDERLSERPVISIGPPPGRQVLSSSTWMEYSGAVEVPPGSQHVRFTLQLHSAGTISFDALEAGYVGR